MKNIISRVVFCLVTISVNAQVAIGKTTLSSTTALLDFDNALTNRKGIILPSVENLTYALAPVPVNNNGTFLFDKTDNKVKMYENNLWVNLSDAGSKTQIIDNTSTDHVNNQGVIIGAETSPAKGVLVLEATNKAMILPWVPDPHINVKGAYPGMMCYDTTSRTLAIYDGVRWNYWK